MKKIIISVSNDLVTDQRVHRVALSLAEFYEVVLLGRKLQESLPLNKQPYFTTRMKLLFKGGPLFYAELNMRLFLFLLFNKANLLLANDLDTLLPNYLISKIKNIELYYDTHEYFTEVPELQKRPLVKKIWEIIEAFIFPKLNNVYTVNQSIANLYHEKYKTNVEVIRNVPIPVIIEPKDRNSLGLPENKKIVIFQGAGINVDRGAEEALLSMKFTADDVILLFIGGGDVFGKLQSMADLNKLSDKVIFIPKVPVNNLRQYTMHASLGLTLDKDTNLNYRYSLPNKLFDYIHAGVPVLSSKLIEIEKIIQKYNIGKIVTSHKPEEIGNTIMEMLNSSKYDVWKKNTNIAAHELSWEKEKYKLLKIYKLNN